MKNLCERYIASLPSHKRQETWRDVGKTRPAGYQTLEISKGTDPKSSVRITYHGNAEWSVAAEEDLSLLEDVMSIRLREVLREDMGAVYTVSSRARFYRHPSERYAYSVAFTCAPENVEKLKQAVFDVLASIRKEGIGEDYINKVKELRRRKLETNLKNNRFWSTQLIRHFRYGTDPGKIIALQEDAIEHVSSTNLQRAARLYLGENRIDALLQPETYP